MAKVPAFATYLHKMCIERKATLDSGFEGCDEILAYLVVRSSEGADVKITELVQSLMFGTGPTVLRKVSTLTSRGLIQLTTSKTDARAKDIKVTAAGMDRMKDQTRLMKSCLE